MPEGIGGGTRGAGWRVRSGHQLVRCKVCGSESLAHRPDVPPPHAGAYALSDSVRLFLLGPARVEAGGTVVRGFESRKALALLCYLAATRLPAPRSRLADLFWGDKAERRGRGNLSRVLHNISRLLPGIINSDRYAVELEWPVLWTDLEEFSALESQSDIAPLTRAARLHRSEFLAGLDLDDCPEFVTWLDGERERWRRRVAQTLLRLAEYHARRWENDQALKYASGLLVLEPWCEEAHREMMRALARSGQRSAALAEYDACRRMLAAELGVAPSAETNDLYHRIKATRHRPQTNSPVETTPF